MSELLKRSVFLDTETLGLTRGQGLHELAVYNLATNEAKEFILTPNLVQVQAAVLQEYTKLASSSADIHQLIRASKWMDILRIQLHMEVGTPLNATDAETLDAIARHSPWLAGKLAVYPHLTNSSEDLNARVDNLRKHAPGLVFSSQTISPENLFAKQGPLATELAGKIVWTANAPFDAKQIGAVVGGLEDEGIETGLRQILETSSGTPDSLYVTGKEVNQARVLAHQTGDWTPVWKAYNQHLPAAGETAVRDIQDVLRSLMSYGKNLGLLDTTDVYWGTNLDLVYRLMGSTEQNGLAQLLAPEAHRATEDLVQHSKYVLEKALSWNTVLEQVSAGTPVDDKQLDTIATYFKRIQHVKPRIDEENLVKRMARAQIDLIKEQETYQRNGWTGIKNIPSATPSGTDIEVPILQANRQRFTSLDDMAAFLKKDQKYKNMNIDQAVSEISAIGGSSAVERIAAIERHTHARGEKFAQYLANEAPQIINIKSASTAAAMAAKGPSIANKALKALGSLPESKWSLPAMAAGAIAGAGFLYSMFGNKTEQSQRSVLTYNYNDWVARESSQQGIAPNEKQLRAAIQAQDSFYKQNLRMEGMQAQGVGHLTRRRNTDFGSPYQGIQGSSYVLHDQQILQEREKYLRTQYNVRHFDPEFGLFGENGILARARHQGYSYIPGGEQVANGYSGLRGRNLMKINLGDGKWKMDVDDADTVVLKRGGLRGMVADLFGMNKQYQFRMSGIDAPEIEHSDQRARYHAPQPASFTAIEGFKQILSEQKNIELVFNPQETTYGRMLGVVLGDNKNLNYELVRRGNVAFLPFGKEENDMQKWAPLKKMQDMAVATSRGMWAHPYWKAYHDMASSGGQSITFNTFTEIEKIAERQSTMDTLALMEQAEALGQYSAADAVEAASIGKFTHRSADNVKPWVTGQVAAHYDSYLHEMMTDTARWSRTHGTGMREGKFSARGGYGKLDKALVLDSMGHTDSIWSRRKLKAYDRYSVDKQQMANSQQRALRDMNNTTQNHAIM